jgi:hypothetical protein
MLHVGVEDGGSAQQCMVCPLARTEPPAALYVLLWERDMHPLTGAAAQADRRFLGGMVRLCWEHLDELAILMAEVL